MRVWLILAMAASASGATLPLGVPGPPSKPHPAVLALRGYAARVETNLGSFSLRFFPDAAPNAVRCFVKAAVRGLYDGLPLTEVLKAKAVVFGDGSKGERIEAEKSPLSPSAGSVAFVRDSEGRNIVGQLRFILAEESEGGEETIFAEVSDGLAVVKRLGSVATRTKGERAVPVEEVLIEKVVVTRTTED